MTSSTLTSDKISSEPDCVVPANPVQEGKQGVHIAVNALASGSDAFEVITDVDRLFNEGVSGISRPSRRDRTFPCHLVHVRLVRLEFNVKKLGQGMANFGACCPHSEDRGTERDSRRRSGGSRV